MPPCRSPCLTERGDIRQSLLYAERNQNFAEDAQKALQKKGQQIVVYCGRGGKLTTGIKGRRGTYDDPDRCIRHEGPASNAVFLSAFCFYMPVRNLSYSKEQVVMMQLQPDGSSTHAGNSALSRGA